MRHLLHFGLFVVALTAVTQADAQDRRRGDRQTTVVIATGAGSRAVRPVRASVEPPRAIYDSRRTVYTSSRPAYDARRAYFDQRQDLEQIVRITERWEQATARRDRHAQSKVDRRLDAWLEREIRESVREPHNHRYTQRVRVLSDELAMLERHGRKGTRPHTGTGIERTAHGTASGTRPCWLLRQEGKDPQRARRAFRTASASRASKRPLSVSDCRSPIAERLTR